MSGGILTNTDPMFAAPLVPPHPSTATADVEASGHHFPEVSVVCGMESACPVVADDATWITRGHPAVAGLPRDFTSATARVWT